MFKTSVISKSGTFYPIQHSNADYQSLTGLCAYSCANLGEEIRYFLAGKRIYVLANWNDILFMISSEIKSRELLYYCLENIKNIAIFLFGEHFENSMNDCISLDKCVLFGQYVDQYLKDIENDTFFRFGYFPHSSLYNKISRALENKIPVPRIPPQLQFLECLIYKNQKIIARFSNSDYPLPLSDIINLSIFEQISYDIVPDLNEDLYDSNYISSSPSPLLYRGGWIHYGGNVQMCLISSVRLAENSPYVILFISKEPKNINRDLVMNIMGFIAVEYNEIKVIPIPQSLSLPTILVGIFIGNRTRGNSWEYYPSTSESSIKITKTLLSKAQIYACEALSCGNYEAIWKDELFTFIYQLKFLNQKGEFINPIPNENNFRAFKKIGHSHWTISRIISNFARECTIMSSDKRKSQEKITVCEIFGVYLVSSPLSMILNFQTGIVKTLFSIKKKAVPAITSNSTPIAKQPHIGSFPKRHSNALNFHTQKLFDDLGKNSEGSSGTQSLN